MNQPKTRTKYLHISSKHRLNTVNDKASIKVHLGQPIKNVYRVAVKSFSMANAMFNIRSGENKLEWAEFYFPQGNYALVPEHRIFSITIPTGYYAAEDLCTTINALISAMPAADHIVSSDAGELPLLMSFSQDQDGYFIKVSTALDAGDTGVKYFSPLQTQNTIWRMLGFTEKQVVNTLKRKKETNYDDIKNEVLDVANNVAGDFYTYIDAHHQAGGYGSPTIFQSNLPTTIESPNGIYLTSDTLTTGGTYETRTHPDSLHLDAMPQAILEFIQFDKGRYSWIHYNASLPHYHYLNDTTLHDIDIQLRSENGVVLTHSEVGEYNLVIVFETVVEDEYSAEFIKAYNRYGYDLAHTPERITTFKN